MAPRGRSRKLPARMDAALDAMRVFGFPQNLVRQAVGELLQVYGDEGWYFFEADSYSVLLDVLIEKQQAQDREKDDSSPGVAVDSGHTLTNTSATGPLNGSNVPTLSMEVADTAIQTYAPLDSIQIDEAMGKSQNNEADHSSLRIRSSQVAEVFPVRTRRPCYGWISSDDDGDEDLVKLTPAPLPDCVASFFSGKGGQGERKTRWDV